MCRNRARTYLLQEIIFGTTMELISWRRELVEVLALGLERGEVTVSKVKNKELESRFILHLKEVRLISPVKFQRVDSIDDNGKRKWYMLISVISFMRSGKSELILPKQSRLPTCIILGFLKDVNMGLSCLDEELKNWKNLVFHSILKWVMLLKTWLMQ